ncbi:MAG TPA: PP2C family protein-serine/threonine phosphatase [Thermoanaerobaculia bacterium]|nr:PP2C family protein-serine/threonine phosphatase [Thermoanaerobaculia bacterium]
MAWIRDWFDLGKTTITSVSANDVQNLYALEWPETKKVLIADHEDTITGERRRVKRWMRTGSAILFGLAKRLSPLRRLMFILAFVAFFACLAALAIGMESIPVRTFIELTLSFTVVTLLLAMELIDKIKMRDELVLARELQASLIPKHPPQPPGWEIAAFNHIANTVGGDIYDFVPLSDGRVAVLFGDASGHGMAAGLVMAVAHAAFRTQLDVDPSPAAITGSLNRILCRTGGSRSFFSCCYVLLTPGGRFTATLAGHPQILKIDACGKVVERIGCGAYPLGIKPGLHWEELHGSLAPGERLLLHSDGLTEARNLTDSEFGDNYVEAIAGWQPQASAPSLVDELVAEWRAFTSGKPADDDMSIAVIRRTADVFQEAPCAKISPQLQCV